MKTSKNKERKEINNMASKNASTKVKVPEMKLVMSCDCEKCTDKCDRGIEYLKRMEIKKCGTGCPCKKTKI